MLKRYSVWVIAPLLMTMLTGLAPRQASAEDRGQLTAEDPQQASADDPQRASADDPQRASADHPQRKMIVDRISRQLGRIKPVGSQKKAQEDFFVLGTANLIRETGHADVKFDVKQGQRTTAEFLFDFMAEASAENPRDWHIFYRVKDGEQAQQALQQARTEYDEMASYRSELMRRYQANSMRRC